MQRRIGKPCVKLGRAWGVGADDLPPKPKWMRWGTNERMQAKALEAQDVTEHAFCRWAEMFMGRRSQAIVA